MSWILKEVGREIEIGILGSRKCVGKRKKEELVKLVWGFENSGGGRLIRTGGLRLLRYFRFGRVDFILWVIGRYFMVLKSLVKDCFKKL